MARAAAPILSGLRDETSTTRRRSSSRGTGKTGYSKAIHAATANHVGTAALGCPCRAQLDEPLLKAKQSGASLRWTAGAAVPTWFVIAPARARALAPTLRLAYAPIRLPGSRWAAPRRSRLYPADRRGKNRACCRAGKALRKHLCADFSGSKTRFGGQILSCASSMVLKVPAARNAKIADPRLVTLLLGTSTGRPRTLA